jgi:probable H4MPT-linked C1 transfer pathway protein
MDERAQVGLGKGRRDEGLFLREHPSKSPTQREFEDPRNAMRVLGLDVGGAGIKGAIVDSVGGPCWAGACRFPLWKNPSDLRETLSRLVQEEVFEQIALTMTGELCDAFETKKEGVAHIVEATVAAFSPRPVAVWQATGRFVPPAQAIAEPWETAAGNWLALAMQASRAVPAGRWLLVDVGSTTTDLLAIVDGEVLPRGRTDPDRLASRELLYRGVRRTPIAAVLREATLAGVNYPLMAELFATTLDAYLVLGRISPDPSAADSADGRAETVPFAVDRLARMIGSDRTRFTLHDALELARQVHHRQVEETGHAMEQVAQRAGFTQPWGVVRSGEGEWLVGDVADRFYPDAPVVSLARQASPLFSRGAAAWGVASLWAQQLKDSEDSGAGPIDPRAREGSAIDARSDRSPLRETLPDRHESKERSDRPNEERGD